MKFTKIICTLIVLWNSELPMRITSSTISLKPESWTILIGCALEHTHWANKFFILRLCDDGFVFLTTGKDDDVIDDGVDDEVDSYFNSNIFDSFDVVRCFCLGLNPSQTSACLFMFLVLDVYEYVNKQSLHETNLSNNSVFCLVIFCAGILKHIQQCDLLFVLKINYLSLSCLKLQVISSVDKDCEVRSVIH